MYIIIKHAGSSVIGPFNSEEEALTHKRERNISAIVRKVEEPK